MFILILNENSIWKHQEINCDTASKLVKFGFAVLFFFSLLSLRGFVFLNFLTIRGEEGMGEIQSSIPRDGRAVGLAQLLQTGGGCTTAYGKQTPHQPTAFCTCSQLLHQQVSGGLVLCRCCRSRLTRRPPTSEFSCLQQMANRGRLLPLLLTARAVSQHECQTQTAIPGLWHGDFQLISKGEFGSKPKLSWFQI